MVFSSLLFLFRFLPAVLLAYYLAPRPLRNLVLLLFSLIFYGWGEPGYLFLMLVSITVSYTGGILIDYLQHRGKIKAAKTVLIFSAAVSLSLLAFFKYADFAAEAVNRFSGTGLPLLHIALPAGISFYTFQAISYTIDVYRGQADVQRSPISFGTYVAMFPQLIAGPIVQYKTIAEQLRTRRETAGQFASGIHRFMLGLGKKVLLANNAGALWNTIQAMTVSGLPAATAWMGLAAYTFQIYFDFSAYSDMAIGLGYMFGFEFSENFNAPYTSRSITDFWRRWHISLGTWFRDYVYIPLGGNRRGPLRQLKNILVVWLLTGIWHGASWNFIVWGLYYGVLLLLEKFWMKKYLEKLPALLQHCYCMFFVMLGWNLFAFDKLKDGLSFMKALFGIYRQGLWNSETIYLCYNHLILLLLCFLGSTKLPRYLGRRFLEKADGHTVLQTACINGFYAGIFFLSVAWLTDASFNPFLYFRF